MTPARLLVLVLSAALVAAACGAAAEVPSEEATPDDVAGEMSTEAVTEQDLGASGSDAADAPQDAEAESPVADEPVADETLVLDRVDGAPTADANVPSIPPKAAIGRPGYTRYVYTEASGQVIPALVEGPRASQVRCQQIDLPCSFSDLVDLQSSGAEIPAALDLSADELDDLVAELSALQTTLDRFADVGDACAAGYGPDRKQTPNMGSHFTNLGLIDGRFDPGEPEILLYARTDGTEPDGALGLCVADGWVGDEVEIVGAAYFMPRIVTGSDHFDGFTGDLDNWHIHYNLCRLDGRDVTVLPADCGPGTPDGREDEPRGDASEGWMIHAWVEPDFDNQLGVFSMWNPTLWPIAAPETVAVRGSVSTTTDETTVITDFVLPDLDLDGPGTFRFFNADGAAHTVTAGTPDSPATAFDTGVIAGRDADEITITEPGEYSYFCEIHPTMQGTITVGGG